MPAYSEWQSTMAKTRQHTKSYKKKSPNNSHQNRAHQSWEIPTHLSKSTRSAELRQLFFFFFFPQLPVMCRAVSTKLVKAKHSTQAASCHMNSKIHCTMCTLQKGSNISDRTQRRNLPYILKHQVCVVIKPALYCKTNQHPSKPCNNHVLHVFSLQLCQPIRPSNL